MERIGLEAALVDAAFTRAMDSYMNAIAKADQQTTRAASSMSSSFDHVTTGSLVLAEVIGNVLYGAINKVISTFTGLGQQALGVVSAYERLALSLETLIAREFQNAKATDNMTDALERAKTPARELINWVTLLAIKSPFDQQGVAAALQTAVAYGFVTQAAKDVADAQSRGIVTAQRLTESLINWAAGAGKSTSEMNRATYALGQMKAAGRVMRQDLMQLTTAGIPVNEMLQEMGLNFATVTKEAVNSDEFILKLVERLERDFGSAAERQADTISGLMNSMGDLRAVLLREFFGPIDQATGKMGGVLGAIKPLLSDFVNAFTSEPVLNNVRAFGFLIGDVVSGAVEKLRSITSGTNKEFNAFLSNLQSLAPELLAIVGVAGSVIGALIAINTVTGLLRLSVSIVTGVISTLASTFMFLLSPIGLVSAAIVGMIAIFVSTAGKVRTEVNTQFGQTANDAYSWGNNIVNSLAAGMINAIVAVINAIASIGRVIAGWLQPGSPPKLLPNIDKWGAAAMTEYVNGFRLADFSVFSDISRTMQSFFRSLSKDQMGEQSLVPTILESRKVLADLINEVRNVGEVTDDMLATAFKAFGPLTKEFQDYVKFSLQMEAVTKKVEDAQYELNAVTSFYDDLLSSMNAELRSLQEDFDSSNRLEQIQEAMATGLLTDAERAKLENERKQILLKRQIKEVEAAREQDIQSAKEKVESALEEQMAVESQLQAQRELIQIQTEQNTLLKEQIALLDRLAKEAENRAKDAAAGGAGGGAAAPETKPPALPEIVAPDAGGIVTSAQEIKEALQKKIGEIVSVFQPVTDAWSKMGDAWAPVIEDLASKFRFLTDKGITPFKKLRIILKNFIPEEYWTTIDKAVDSLEEWLTIKIPAFLEDAAYYWDNTILPALNRFWEFVSTKVIPVLEWLWSKFLEALPIIAPFVAGFWIAINVMQIIYNTILTVITVVSSLGPVFETIMGIIIAVTSPVGLIILGIATAVGILAAAWYNNWGGIRDIVADIWNNTLLPIFKKLWEWLKETLGKALKFFADLWSDTLWPAIKTVWNWVKNTLFPLLSEWWTWLKDKLSSAVQRLTDFWEKVLLPALKGVWDWMSTVLFPFFESISNFISAVFTVAVQGLADVWKDHVQPALEKIWSLMKEKLFPAMEDIWRGIKESLQPAWESLGRVWNDTILPALESIGNVLTETVMPAFRELKDKILDAVKKKFEDLTSWIKTATDWLNTMAEALFNLGNGGGGDTGGGDTGGGTGEDEGDPGVGHKKSGGSVFPNKNYVVGEEGPEILTMGKKPGYITPTHELVNALLNSVVGRQLSRAIAPTTMVTNNITRNVYLTINPNYETTQSPVSIYYDVTAALAGARI